ncbi:MAG: DAK2 domain-containing protein [Solobacterium sp.]|jgi:DAK2 domain fusion protein YloV|nr:DAK2 domain-containing protein [Solobacterium sp.]MCH4222425.1 DAK2 domain-containing protein [Solobacterium sp.]MCH4265301.1 DAK2 domain-containing protein [Solobacterium sp.]
MDNINGKIFKEMLESGCNNLLNRQDEINALNVFPVPDGDTGTNMSLTYSNGMNEVQKSGSEQLPVVAKVFSRGLLMGARGNSGVILSQIFRGFSQSVTDSEELDSKAFADAMMNGAMLAYKAVMRPVEGTILTVIREASEYGQIYVQNHAGCSINEYMDLLCKEAKASLDRTPELLPVLKEARVVDSGGSGLVCVLDGFRAYLLGSPIKPLTEEEKQAENDTKAVGYCTEFILKMSDKGSHVYKEDKLRNALEQLGSSITLIKDNDLIKVRITTMMPGEVLNQGQRYGEFTDISISNLSSGESKPSILENDEEVSHEEKEFGIITVAAGDGLKKLFMDYRADVVVSGGQTMNPSTEDFVSAIKKVNARHIFILPNNSNIIMAANQAAQVNEDTDVIVLPTTSIPQGLSACISFNPDDDVNNNLDNMKEAVANVKTGQVTYAIKDTVVDGREIRQGDYMGLFNKEIKLTDPDKVNAACELIKLMCNDDSEIVTLIQGADATEAETEQVKKFIEDNFDVDVDVKNGGQPVYCFIIGVE